MIQLPFWLVVILHLCALVVLVWGGSYICIRLMFSLGMLKQDKSSLDLVDTTLARNIIENEEKSNVFMSREVMEVVAECYAVLYMSAITDNPNSPDTVKLKDMFLRIMQEDYITMTAISFNKLVLCSLKGGYTKLEEFKPETEGKYWVTLTGNYYVYNPQQLS